MNPKSTQFRKLQSEWYQKLKRSGFRDIERNPIDPLGPYLKHPSASVRQVYSSEGYEYFRQVRQFVHVGKFKSRLQKKVFELYGEGKTVREIRAEIGPKAGSHVWVWKLIQDGIARMREQGALEGV